MPIAEKKVEAKFKQLYLFIFIYYEKDLFKNSN